MNIQIAQTKRRKNGKERERKIKEKNSKIIKNGEKTTKKYELIVTRE